MDVEIDKLVIRASIQPEGHANGSATVKDREMELEWLIEQCLERLVEHLNDAH